MSGLARRAKAQDGAGKVDRAELFGPKVVFRHVGEPPERAELASQRSSSRSPQHLAVQRGDGMLAPVDPAAGQLELGHRLGLMRGKDVVAFQKHRIEPGPAGIALPGFTGSP
jgi:hypothetical protein